MPQNHLDTPPLWTPSMERIRRANVSHFITWLTARGHIVPDYSALWEWSVTEQTTYWQSIWDYFHIQSSTPYNAVYEGTPMPDIRWFPGATLNYAEHIFRQSRGAQPALLFQSESSPLEQWSWETMQQIVAGLANTLRNLGVVPGDRVAAYLPNIPQAVAAFLAAASVGAVWSSCSPDFGVSSVLDRFGQIRPKVLFVIDGYPYGGKIFDRRNTAQTIAESLPDLVATISVPYVFPLPSTASMPHEIPWHVAIAHSAPMQFTRVPFDHPLWILYSSGTTGLPKAIVHSHGGMLLHHLTNAAFHLDLHPGDRFFWFTTTGWMMWNIVVSGLLQGATSILYDGHPGFPDLYRLWHLAADTEMTVLGTSAALLHQSLKQHLDPGRHADLHSLTSLGSTGSPLLPEAFEWVYRAVKQDIWLASTSGGTDICNSLVGGVPLLPVYAGEIQARTLGAAVAAYDDRSQSIIEATGELVVTHPLPSMPIRFWNDPTGQRYRATYFERYPGVWHHGDWIRITSRGTVIIYGRSDATLNRMGVRMGSADVYRVVEGLTAVQEALIVELEDPPGTSWMPLFVHLRDGIVLTESLTQSLRDALRTQLSPRHVPDMIYAVPGIPKTLNGKKLEVPIKKLFMGFAMEDAVNRETVANPEVLSFFEALAHTRRPNVSSPTQTNNPSGGDDHAV
ncbi:MAG: acetoacetate--CoA ligase [Sulfobacillus benefaciens]|uniref:Acetoacetate--CoA ligase n=1 Tax=Sulfobacillus benefaciens TaxID=453960 RepID=A0A2T2XCS7_9FIRM|nr:MAG: acetoacetate--CoA ligase [Sulfobacillus benefaciens]